MISDAMLPTIFMGLIGIAIFAYAVLDGYDLGVGILLPTKPNRQEQRDQMIASIGPFWDANETWLVLAVGLLLIAFPAAHNVILRELYLPATTMLIGLIVRGVAFDFRAKAITSHRLLWDRAFKVGSLLTALTQGYMLGRYVLGFSQAPEAYGFALLSSLCVTASYAFIGGAWLVMKTEAELQSWVARATRRAAWLAALGILAVSLVNPLVSSEVFQRWFSFPAAILLMPLPLVCVGLFIVMDRYLAHMPHHQDFGCWIPFVVAVTVFFLCFSGLAYSFYPYVIPGQLTAMAAASAPESLRFILAGALVVVPIILIYTAFSYRVFWGKVGELRYY
ncbi:cytochrome d ubiquinol oxidase subunit II [Halioxenophilus sp. WMMB6]|uniref:cytochrome d ubiquinol oxidase subunit II n=1 Tax=Halioxenophilus sp. WMMB6 TaxID=3073815 RepID=UPI00295F1C5F|nr:cytochrome d ubiquinol oxidase subunit II [Halioxenophilus sp. WMMB6]